MKEVNFKRIFLLCLFAVAVLSIGLSIDPDKDKPIDATVPPETTSQFVETPPITNMPTLSPTQKSQLTEKDYKSQCKEFYNDDFFKSKPEINTHVKFYGFTNTKYIYNSSDMQGIIVRDITDKYDLETECIACAIMHESTKNDAVPSYYGESVYIMFKKNGKYNFDEMLSGEHIIVYGEIIQNTNGIFILPEYIEKK